MEKGDFGKIRQTVRNNEFHRKQMEFGEEKWNYYDSSLAEIGSSFIKALPDSYTEYTKTKIFVDIPEWGEIFKKYTEDTLRNSPVQEKVGIEFGGPGSQFFQGFSKGIFSRTAGVCLEDIRNHQQINKDSEVHHALFEGNVLDVNNQKLYQNIKEHLQTDKVDFIIERMMGPLEYIEKHPAIVKSIMEKWYEMLREGGLMFVQFEFLQEHHPIAQAKYESEIEKEYMTPNEKLITDWAKKVQELYPDTLEIQVGRGVLRLVKKEGAPEKLPMEEVFQ